MPPPLPEPHDIDVFVEIPHSNRLNFVHNCGHLTVCSLSHQGIFFLTC